MPQTAPPSNPIWPFCIFQENLGRNVAQVRIFKFDFTFSLYRICFNFSPLNHSDLRCRRFGCRSSFSAVTSVWPPFVFGFKSPSAICGRPSDYTTWSAQEFGLLPKGGFLIILHFHCLVSVLNFPLPLIQTYDAVALVDQVTALLNILLLWLTKRQFFPIG